MLFKEIREETVEKKPALNSNLKKPLLSDKNLEFGLLAALLIGALLLRLYNLTRTSFWYDEVSGLVRATDRSSLVDALFYSVSYNIHPPLQVVMLNFWFQLSGYSEFWLRLFSVIPAIATLGLLYLLTRPILGQRVALTSVLLLSLSSLSLYWSQSIRNYSWFTFLATLSMWLCWRVNQKPMQVGRWVAYGVSAIVLLYSEYMSFHLIFGQAIFLLVALFPNRKAILRLAITLVLVGLSFLPYLGNFLEEAQQGPSSYLTNNGPVQLLETIETLTIWFTPASYLFIAGAIFFPLYLIGIRWLWQNMQNLAIFLITWGLLPWITAWLSSLIRPNFSAIYYIWCVPAILIVMAIGVWHIGGQRKYIPYIALSLVVISSGIACLNYNKNYHNQDWRTAINYIVANKQEGDTVFLPNGFAYTRKMWDFYYEDELGSPGNLDIRSFPAINVDQFTTPLIEDKLKGSKRVWMIGLYSETKDSIRWKVLPKIPASYKTIYSQNYWSNQGQTLILSLLEKSNDG